MLKNIIATSLVAAALIFSACGDPEGEEALAFQHSVDTGSDSEVAAAILRIETVPLTDLNDTEKEVFLATLDDTTKKTLASAYMDKAGVGFLDMITKIDTASETASDTNNNTSDDSFANLASELAGEDINVTTQKVKDIDSAITYYLAMSKSSNAPARAISRDVNTTDDIADEIKLYLGIAYMAKATMLLGYLGDVAALEDGQEDVTMNRTIDAMKCVYGNDCTNIGFVNYDEMNTTILYGSDINGVEWYRIATYNTTATSVGDSLLIADYQAFDAGDYSSVINADGSIKTGATVDLPFGNDYRLDVQLLDALNGAFDVILDTAPDDVKDDIREYRTEIDTNADDTISEPEIRAYIK